MQYTVLIPAYVYLSEKISPSLTYDRCFCALGEKKRKGIIDLTKSSRFQFYDKLPKTSGRVFLLADLAIRVGSIVLLDCCLKTHLRSSILNPIRVLYLGPILTKILTCLTNLEKEMTLPKKVSPKIQKIWEAEKMASNALFVTLLASLYLPIFSLKVSNDQFGIPVNQLKLLVLFIKIWMTGMLSYSIPILSFFSYYDDENLSESKRSLDCLEQASNLKVDFDNIEMCKRETGWLDLPYETSARKQVQTFKKEVYTSLYKAQIPKYLKLVNDLDQKLDTYKLNDLSQISNELKALFEGLKSHKEEAELLISLMLARANQSSFFRTDEDANKLKLVFAEEIEVIKKILSILSTKYKSKLEGLAAKIISSLTLNNALDSFESLDHKSLELFKHTFYNQLLEQFIPERRLFSDDPDQCKLLFQTPSTLIDLKGETALKLIHLSKLLKFGKLLHSIWQSKGPMYYCGTNIEAEEFFARLKIALTAKNPEGKFRVLEFGDHYAFDFYKEHIWKLFVNHPIDPHDGPLEVITHIVLPHTQPLLL